MARPIGDKELEYYENLLGAALKQIRTLKALIYHTDDPEILEMLLIVHQKAQFIRKSTIEWRDARKKENNDDSTRPIRRSTESPRAGASAHLWPAIA